MSKTNISNFEKYLNSGEVSEVIVIRNKSSVRVTLTPDALRSSEHQAVVGKNILGQENIKGPHYQFEVGSLELFEEKLEKARSNGINFRLEFITIENRWLDTIIGFLPIIIIIGVWIFEKINYFLNFFFSTLKASYVFKSYFNICVFVK